MIFIIFSFFINAEYFDGKIEYFSENQQAKLSKPKSSQGEKQKKFEWKTYLDEKNDEFFKEGDYIPPAPFLEAMRNPSRQNILLFEKWNEKKNFLLNRFNQKRAEVLGKNPLLTEEVKNQDLSLIKEFNFVFYFDSMCSSCKGMFEVINNLVASDVFIEAVRLDESENQVLGLSIPWSKATRNELKHLNITAVPMLMAYKKGSNDAYKIVGKKSVLEITEILQKIK